MARLDHFRIILHKQFELQYNEEGALFEEMVININMLSFNHKFGLDMIIIEV